MFCSRVAEARRSLLDTTNLVAGFDAKIAVVKPWQNGDMGSNQSSKGGTETGGPKGY